MLLLIHHYPVLCPHTIFRTGTGAKIRDISLGVAFEATGEKHSAAILGFHAATGLDQTGKFNGKSKKYCWKVFRAATDNDLQTLKSLGKGSPSSHETIRAIEHFVMTIYIKNIPSKVKDIDNLQ